MCLRTVEEKKKFTFYNISFNSRKKILDKIALMLEKEKEIIFAVIYGGFIDSKIFRDIDIAVFTGYKVPYEGMWSYTGSLAKRLEEVASIPVDIKMLDYAPPSFRVEILKKGKVIVDKEPYIRIILKWASLCELNDISIKCNKIKSILGEEVLSP